MSGLSPGAPTTGRTALERLAPSAVEPLRALEAAIWDGVTPGERAALRVRAVRLVAAQNELPSLAVPPALARDAELTGDPTAWRAQPGLSEPDRAALTFAEHMGFDVASIGDEERGALAALGGDAVAFAQTIYVADMLPRGRAALDALFGMTPEWPAPATPSALQPAFDEWIRCVGVLDALDPVSSELVRMVGAERHRCRICQSLRNRTALRAGADEALLGAVAEPRRGELAPAHRAAVAFADAMIQPPGRVGPDLARALREAYEPAACVELVLDVLRNATNKVAVALAADAPNVDAGLEVYDIGPEGELLFGLEAT